ncbi:sugar ABC transporter permease [Brevibacillus sp. SYP-B805]|uniref:carbohydrate ABC transporter permease n=1 Tax=Brevibacillus sp. SYP-B805 TaxID=1578199 RepID=UPI0013EA1B5F|nr:sugar ABC transporter permease [Brevibacillus sp. SYP-B805]NGQ95961.1 sugar ABC transporter permease [Brevibacillus sp. SYP-B805]
MKRKLSDAQFAWLIIAPSVVIVFGIVLYPLFETFLYSLKDLDLSAGSLGDYVWLHNYLEILSDGDFWASAGRTAYFAAVSISLELILGTLIALLLNEEIKGKTFLRSIIIIPWAVPTIVNGAMWKWIYHSEYGALNALLTQLHLIDHYHSWLNSPWMAMNMVIIADVWKMTPLVTIFLLASLQLVNKSVYEAAMVDGAGMIRRFFTLTLPYLKPTLLVIIVMRTMETFKVFDIIYAITQGGPANGTMVLTYQAYLKAFSNLQYSQGATISYLIGMMIALLTYGYVKMLKRGEAA